MNCKPGDLAYIARSDFDENVGKPVEVLNAGFEGEGGFIWTVKSNSLLAGWGNDNTVQYGTHLRIYDRDLRPISAPPAECGRIADTFDPLYTALGISR